MADEIRRVITVDVSGAVSSLSSMRSATEETSQSFASLKDAKKHLDELRASLLDLEEGSEEYQKRVEEITDFQEKLKKAMKASADTADNAEGSYNALSKTMSELKKQWKATSDEAERNALGAKILDINNQLKTMDASIGNYQRNVGNYENAFTKALTGITDKIEALNNPLSVAKQGVLALGTAFKALIANPVGAVIMAIVVALQALKKGFEQSESASNSLKRAFSVLQPVVNAVSNVFTGMATVVGRIAEYAIPAMVTALQSAGSKIVTVLNKIGLVSDENLAKFQQSILDYQNSMKITQGLTEREISLTERRRKFQVEEARTEMEISQLRAQSADKDKYSAQERQKFLESAISKERNLNNERLAIAQEEYDILNERSKLADNDAKTNDELAAAEARLYNVRRDYYQKERELIAQLSEAKKSQSSQDKSYLDEQKRISEELRKIREEEQKKILEIQDRAVLSRLSTSEREIEIVRRQYEEEKALLEKYGQDTVALTEEYLKKVEEIRAKNGGDRAREIQERALQSLMSSTDRELDILTKKYEEEKKLLEEYGENTVNLTDEYQRRRAEIYANDGEGRIKQLSDEAALEQYIADKTIQNEYEKKERLLQIDRERLEGQKAIYEELFALDDLSVEKKQEYADKLTEINADIENNTRQVADVQKQQTADLIQTYTQVANGIANLMGSVVDVWQDSIKQRQKTGKISEDQAKKEWENSKKLQISMAIIQGLAGVANAISNAYQLPPLIAPIVAGINSAAVIASTAAQVAKIKSTSFDGGGSVGDTGTGSATPTATATAYAPQYSTNVTGQSQTTSLANAVTAGTNDQRVFIVESDIEEMGKRVQVRESESTF